MTTHRVSADSPVVNPAFHAGDPHPTYRKLRSETPLFWHEQEKIWIATKHADLVRVSRDPRSFCSRQGILLSDSARQLGENDPILYMDPPQHRDFRKLVQPAFGLKRIRALEARIREIAAELVDELCSGEVLDFVEGFSSPLPTLVIAELLGVPGEDRADFRRWSDAMIEAATAPTPETAVLAGELHAYLAAVIADRRRKPRKDLISVLARAELAGAPLSERELVMLCLTLLVAGNETTRNLLSHGALLLTQHPDALDDLARHPAQIRGAVEEMLRFEPPVIGFTRTATRSVELRGQRIAAGERVWMLYGAANRDEEVFGDDAELFRIDRSPNPHLSFGIGEHFCLGAELARIEARVGFEELLARFPSFGLAGEVRRLPSTIMRPIAELPLKLHG